MHHPCSQHAELGDERVDRLLRQQGQQVGHLSRCRVEEDVLDAEAQRGQAGQAFPAGLRRVEVGALMVDGYEACAGRLDRRPVLVAGVPADRVTPLDECAGDRPERVHVARRGHRRQKEVLSHDGPGCRYPAGSTVQKCTAPP
jgi:hypothetical protein